MASEGVTATIIRGNVVTPDKILYGGFVKVVGDTIVAVNDSNEDIPSLRDGNGNFYKHNEQDITEINIIDSPWIIPGFVDIHNHGVGGCEEVCDHWSVPEYTQRYLAQTGTLSCLASVIFSTTRSNFTYKVIKTINERQGKVYENCCVIEGMHAEGPVIKDQGGLPSTDEGITQEDFEELCTKMTSLKVMTISPYSEARVGYSRMRHLMKIGCRVSLGHDRQASETDIEGALVLSKEFSSPENPEHNRLHCTHMYNVMAHHHRNPSLIDFLLCRDYPRFLSCYKCQPPTIEVIGDLIHVHPVCLQNIFSARPISQIAFITDCISSYHPGKRLKYNGREIIVRAEGGCYLCDAEHRPTTTLAGSTCTLSEIFKTLLTCFNFNVHEVCLMVATNPARIANIDHVGAIAAGKKANLLLMDSSLGVISQRMIYGVWSTEAPYTLLRSSHIKEF